MTALITVAYGAAATTPEDVRVSELDLGHVEIVAGDCAAVIGIDEDTFVWSTYTGGELMSTDATETEEDLEKALAEWIAEVTR